MGHAHPFRPEGTCSTCRFSEPIPNKHWQKKYHTLHCRRHPPTGPQAAPGCGPWNVEVPVQDSDYCAEYKKEGE